MVDYLRSVHQLRQPDYTAAHIRLGLGSLGRKVTFIAFTCLTLLSIISSLILFVIEPQSSIFRVLVSVSVLLGLIGVAAVLTSLQAFFGERREIGKRLIYEVRTHRAETRLLRAELDEASAALTSLLRETRRGVDHRLKALPHETSEKGADRNYSIGNTQLERKLESIGSEIEDILQKLNRVQKNQESVLPTMTMHLSVRSKQLVSLLETQRHELEHLRNNSLTS